ncbi:hypothetical protein ACFV4N_02610 [Actinosynnema sp. NPDC059797]
MAGDKPTAGLAYFDGEPLVRLLATAFVRLSQLRTAGDPVYPDVVQNAYNHVVLHCIRRGVRPPGSVPDLVRWAAERPLSRWPFTLPADQDAGELVLVDAETGSPTQECLEWAVSAPDPAAERFENDLMREVLTLCRAARAPEAYTAFRRLLIEQPTLTSIELARLGENLDLDLLHDTVKRSYSPITARYVRDGKAAVCAGCNCLLVPVGEDRYICLLDRCRRQPVRVSRVLDPAAGGGIHQLTRPLRTFITGPGLAEIELEAELRALGLTPVMWPNFDAYDLEVRFPDGRVWALDVKDRANPALLGRATVPLRPDPPYDRGLLVVPHYRFTERDGYREVFLQNLPEGMADYVSLLTDRELVREAKATLRRRRTVANTGGDRDA